MNKRQNGSAETLCPKLQCTGCGACFNRCDRQAISMEADEEGFAYPKIDTGKCVGCGLCEKACPQLNPPAFHPPMGKRVYAAWAKDDSIRLASSSGGLYTVFAQEILKRGGLVNGVAYDQDFNLTHRLVDKVDDLASLRGSKYVQSDIGDIYRQVEDALRHGRSVLFTSTPCQVAGLYSFLGKQYDNLITCDFVCHGVPSSAFFKLMVAEVVKKNRVTDPVAYRFRDLNRWGFRPALVDKNGIEYQDGVTDKFYFQTFLRGLNYRENCYQCRHASFSRVADLTIGDFWGIGTWWPFRHADKMKGVSLLLVNTPKGKAFVDCLSESALYRELRDIHECDENRQLYEPVERRVGRKEFYAKLKANGLEACDMENIDVPLQREIHPFALRRLRSLCARAIGKILQLVSVE